MSGGSWPRVRGVLRLLVALLPIWVGTARAGNDPTLDLVARLQQLVDLGAPGAMALVRIGEREQVAAAGLADVETRRRADIDDVFRIASITKMVTATIVLQLASEKKLSLDDAVGKHLRSAHRRVARISIRQLLDHSSRIPEYLTDGRAMLSARSIIAMLKRRTPQRDLVAQAIAGRWNADPFSEYDYSNTNYVLLAQVIEAVTGQSFESAVAARVIEPLGLHRTGFPDAAGRLPFQHMRAYLPADGLSGVLTDFRRLVDVTEHPYTLGGDGGLFSSLADLSRLLDAVWTAGVLLDARAQASRFARMRQDHEARVRYGLGVMAIGLSCGITIVGHEGRDIGLTTLAFDEPLRRRRIVLVINTVVDGSPKLEQALSRLQSDVFCGLEKGIGTVKGSRR